MDLTDSMKTLFIETAKQLRGHARRVFMARTVKELGLGGQRRAERELGWSPTLIRKGTRELETGLPCLSRVHARGRKPAEAHLPNLLVDIRALTEAESHADPQLRSAQLYTRLTAAEVRRQLIAQKGYTDSELPTVETIRVKLNELGFVLRQVAKSQPQKRSPKPTLFSPNSRR